nr:MAG TPA: hypothetical protein [Crassvirales sp.]
MFIIILIGSYYIFPRRAPYRSLFASIYFIKILYVIFKLLINTIDFTCVFKYFRIKISNSRIKSTYSII